MKRLIISAIILFAMSLPVKAQVFTCPLAMTKDGNNLGLTDSRIFEGSPDQGNEVMPDDGEWDLAEYQAMGEKLYVVCHYGDATQQFELPIGQNFCTVNDENVLCR